jgi:hypothetical protein
LKDFDQSLQQLSLGVLLQKLNGYTWLGHMNWKNILKIRLRISSQKPQCQEHRYLACSITL